MIDGLPLEYAHARLSARLGDRPDERCWQRARSARGLDAVLDAARSSPAAGYVTGVVAHMDSNEIDLAFRQQLRNRIVEVAGWAPQPWRAALWWTAHLIDLPVLVHLLTDEALPDWTRGDSALGAFAQEPRSARREAMRASALAPVVRSLEASASPSTPYGIKLPAALSAWIGEWRRRWPPCSNEERRGLEQLERIVALHLARFASTPVDAAAAARAALGERVMRLLRRTASRPAALFAYLLLVALDLERLRGELAQRAAFVESGAAFATSGAASDTPATSSPLAPS